MSRGESIGSPTDLALLQQSVHGRYDPLGVILRDGVFAALDAIQRSRLVLR
jgi:hypothetical protein